MALHSTEARSQVTHIYLVYSTSIDFARAAPRRHNIIEPTYWYTLVASGFALYSSYRASCRTAEQTMFIRLDHILPFFPCFLNALMFRMCQLSYRGKRITDDPPQIAPYDIQ